jgi:tripartite-type tricarboxylate transporter receptor subunit TctC
MWDYLTEQVETATGAKFLKVPFQSGGAGVTGLLGANVDIAPAFYAEFRAHLEAKKIKAVGVAAEKPLAHLAEVPTFNDVLGGKEYLWTLLRFVVVPKNTPADRKAYLSAAVRAAVKDRVLVEEYNKMGVFFDPELLNAPNPAEALYRHAEREREFYIKTGRLKQ